ncbi:hypothetical protein FRC12_001170 [Ceratobasidium sp. 428]|nr:hypothetical protein FRC12_001170 [Ceratobasidium sp. 428]
MPPNTIMQGGVLPLEKIAALPGVVKQLAPVSRPPSEVSTFAESLELDSPLFLSGILRASSRIRYTIASAGPTTVITHPATSRNVAVIRWVTNASGDTVVETQDLTLRLNKWLETSDWGPVRSRHFKKHGQTPSIKWTEKHGEWEATDSKKRVLAVLVSRRSALGTRLDLTSVGLPHRDALVLTALLTVTGEYDWRRYGSIRDNQADSAEPSASNASDRSSSEPTQQSDGPLPSYQQAPFTRPLAPLLCAPPNTDPGSNNGAATQPINQPPNNTVPALRPMTLTLSSREPLSGSFSEGAQKHITITTLGSYTNIILHSQCSNSVELEPSLPTNSVQLTKVAAIEWAPVSKVAPQVLLGGQYRRITDVMHKNSIFGSHKEKRFGHPDFLPSIVWTEASRTSTASIFNDPNASIRYTCRSHPDNRPLAVLTRYLKRKGTELELTPEGQAIIIEVVLTALLMICKLDDWKVVAGAGVPTEEVIGGTRENSHPSNVLTVGEEMVSDLDGWAGPPALMRLRTDREAGGIDT